MIKKEVDDKMRTTIELNENVPTAKGMITLGVYDNLDFNQIKGINQKDYKNDVRYDVSKVKKTIGKFQDKIKAKPTKYKPKVWGGPTILWTGEVDENGKKIYELITGYHRTIALINEGFSSGYFVVVDFVDFEGRTAKYWKEMWKINENKENEDYVSNTRSDPDIIGKTKSMIKNGDITYDKKEDENSYAKNFASISSALKDMELTKTQINKFVPLIFDALGNDSGVVYPYALKSEWEDFVSKYSDNNSDEYVKTIQFESASEMDYIYRFMMKLMIEMVQSDNTKFYDEDCKIDGVEYKKGDLKEIDTNYLNLTILAKVITGNSMKLTSIREAKKNFFNEMSDIIIKGAKILEYLKTNGNTKLKGAPQNKVEDNEYKKTKQLSFVFNSNGNN